MSGNGCIGTKGFTRPGGGSLALLAISAALVLAQPARAAEPPPPDGQALGTGEALLRYCAKVDSSSAARYEQRLKLLTHGADESAVDEVRKSDEYKQAYESTTSLLGDINEESARRTCSESLNQNK